MVPFRRLAVCLAVALVAGVASLGCASTTVSNRDEYRGRKLPRPDHIIVYDFAATPDGVPANSSLAGKVAAPSQSPSAKELEVGRRLGAEVASNLVERIQQMGLPGVRAAQQPTPAQGDLVIRGYFLSVDQGSLTERMVVGFGSGDASLQTMVEGYLMTSQGLRRLGSGEVESGGGKTPGMAVPLVVTLATANPIGLVVGGAVKAEGELSGSSTIEGSGKRTAEEIATQLKVKFQEQGWIQ